MRSTLRSLLALALALTMALAVAACGGDGDGGSGQGDDGLSEVGTGGELTFNYPAFPDFLDPAMSYTLAGQQALVPTYTGLLSYRRERGVPGSQLIPGLAEALPEVTDGGRTYRLTLREGLRYSDGAGVKASDFEHALKRVISLESPGASFYTRLITGADRYAKAGRPRGDIPGIETDDRTREITIRLKSPSGQFPYLLTLSFAGLVPGDTPFEVLTKNPPPGVGPFKITDVQASRRFVLEKNENWPEIEGLNEAQVDKITVKVVESNERSVRDVLENRADWMDDASAGDALREFKNTAKERYRDEPANGTYYFFVNQRLEPFDDINVRKAVHFAIDKPALARLFGGQLRPACNFLPPGMEGYQAVDPCPFGNPNEQPDVERARQMVRDAGVAGEKVTVWGNSAEQTKTITEYLSDVLNDIGFEAKPRIVDPSVYVQAVGNEKSRAQIGFMNLFQDFPHPGNFLSLVDPDAIQATNNPNQGNVDDPEVKREIDRLDRLELGEAAEGYAALDRRLVENADVVPYGYRTIPVFVSERIAFDRVLFHPVYQTDFTTFALKE